MVETCAYLDSTPRRHPVRVVNPSTDVLPRRHNLSSELLVVGAPVLDVKLVCDFEVLGMREWHAFELCDYESTDFRELPHVREAKDTEQLIGFLCTEKIFWRPEVAWAERSRHISYHILFNGRKENAPGIQNGQ